ncbi:MAG: bacteriohemerythrin [bacterium]|nr:bacteriohemerythrin [bacterium]
MEITKWDQRFSLGIDQIDEQHKRLFELIGNLEQVLMDLSLRKALNDLIEYTETHFSYEQMMLDQAGYPAFDAHLGEHEKFTGTATQTYDQINQDLRSINKKGAHLAAFLRDWLTQHIMKTDKQYVDFMKDKPIPEPKF